MSSAICEICQGSLDGGSVVNRNSTSTSEKDHRIAATQCGHVLHRLCLDRWWDTTLSQDILNSSHYASAGVHFFKGIPVQVFCPVCGIALGKSGFYFPLFPSFADSSGNGDGDIQVKEPEPEKQVEDLTAKSTELCDGPSTSSADK